MPVRALIIVVVAVAVLSGCGRRGDLEPPGAQPAAGAYVGPTNVSPLDPGSTAAPSRVAIKPVPPPSAATPPASAPAPEAAPKRRFFLDFLL